MAQVVVFGDSWSAAGNPDAPFGTSPGPSWPQILARRFGDDQKPRLVFEFRPGEAVTLAQARKIGGLNFAQGGARIAAPRAPGTRDIIPLSLTRQFDLFLAEHKKFAPNQLAIVWGGGNDIVEPFLDENSAQAAKKLRTGQGLVEANIRHAETIGINAAEAEAELVRRILDAGARRVVVLNIIDLGLIPFSKGMNRNGLDIASKLTTVYNTRLKSALPADDRLLLLDIAGEFDMMIASPDEYGYSQILEDACNDASYACGPEHYTTPDAAQRYMFAGWGHFTAHTREMIAKYVERRILEKWPEARVSVVSEPYPPVRRR